MSRPSPLAQLWPEESSDQVQKAGEKIFLPLDLSKIVVIESQKIIQLGVWGRVTHIGQQLSKTFEIPGAQCIAMVVTQDEDVCVPQFFYWHQLLNVGPTRSCKGATNTKPSEVMLLQTFDLFTFLLNILHILKE